MSELRSNLGPAALVKNALQATRYLIKHPHFIPAAAVVIGRAMVAAWKREWREQWEKRRRTN